MVPGSFSLIFLMEKPRLLWSACRGFQVERLFVCMSFPFWTLLLLNSAVHVKPFDDFDFEINEGSNMQNLSVFDYIREINKLPADVLSPAKFKILVEIAMQSCENGNVLAKNKEISIKTGIKPNSVKVLMSQMKKDGFLKAEKIDGKRALCLMDRDSGKRLMVINQNDKKVNRDLPFRVSKQVAPLLNNVVVVLLEKYGFDFGPVIIEKLSRFSDSEQIKAIESTKAYATSNPARYIERILDNDCKGIRLPDKPITDQYAAERERIAILRAEAFEAQSLGFNTAGYSH